MWHIASLKKNQELEEPTAGPNSNLLNQIMLFGGTSIRVETWRVCEEPDSQGGESMTPTCSTVFEDPEIKNSAVKEIWEFFVLGIQGDNGEAATESTRAKSWQLLISSSNPHPQLKAAADRTTLCLDSGVLGCLWNFWTPRYPDYKVHIPKFFVKSL